MRYFTKNLDTILKSAPGMLTKARYSFTKETSYKRNKSGRSIGVNGTHQSRRVFRARGKGVALKGRPRKDTHTKKRSGEPSNCLFPQNVQREKKCLSLAQSVAANKASRKKH